MAALFSSVSVAAADEVKPATTPQIASSTPTLEFERYRLKNGLEVILHREARLPRVAVNLWYHVGPRNEPKGRSGLAHLFEHLMFEGSKHVGPNFDRLLEGAGAANVNGTTSWDRTNYFETLPSHELELALWIESDRMGFMLDTLTQARLDVQRGVVKSERRQSFENAPYGPSTLALYDLLFPPGHAYHGAIIGSMADLDRATLADVRAFFRKYYAPSNATLTLAGDFEPQRARRLIDKYFSSLKGSPGAARWKFQPTSSPRRDIRLPKATTRVVTEHVDVERVALGFRGPRAFGPEHAALELGLRILSDGKSSRLYSELVLTQQLASEVSGELDPAELASVITLHALAARGTALEALERALSGSIQALRQTPPTARELERAKRRIRVEILSELQQLDGSGGETGRAGSLQRFNHYLGDPGGLTQYLNALWRVTAAEVTKAIHTYLDPQHRAVLLAQRAGPASRVGL